MNRKLIVIPAIKKNAAIPDQLIKKLNGITLIQRAIDTALELANSVDQVLIITDSDEIGLIAQRNGIAFKKDKALFLNSENIVTEVINRTKDFPQENVLLYRANTPLIESPDLQSAYLKFLELNDSILVSVKKEDRRIFSVNNGFLVKTKIDNFCEEIGAFYIFNKSVVTKGNFKQVPFFVSSRKSIEIRNYQNWWICEKMLQRKRIVFHVFGSHKIGMGHIFHSLSLAHEITDHEVILVCNEKYELAVKKIASIDYKVIASKDEERTILDLNPDMVINDVLNTEKDFILKLKENGAIVINFEDLGSGSSHADVVFNELHETPQKEGAHYFWGHKYLTLRDEFDSAKPNLFVNRVEEVLIMFGGTDQNNLTLEALKVILDTCQMKKIMISIVCGAGYVYLDKLTDFISKCGYDKIELHQAIFHLSEIMERSQIAISSNGRSVYELAEMNIPSVIISHHKRELTHDFAKQETGFVNIGVFNENISADIRDAFIKLIDNKNHRLQLYQNIKKYNFLGNKKNVMNKIYDMLDKQENGVLHETN
jgi:spore coat polysaccharide biosynthesis predicted glycosyltransferase SpsG/CMP-N-acetylneuraminic acid synthetase